MKMVQAVIWIATIAFSAGTYFHTQATVNAEVQKVKADSAVNSRIICFIAIDLEVKKAKDICTREIFN